MMSFVFRMLFKPLGTRPLPRIVESAAKGEDDSTVCSPGYAKMVNSESAEMVSANHSSSDVVSSNPSGSHGVISPDVSSADREIVDGTNSVVMVDNVYRNGKNLFVSSGVSSICRLIQ